MGQKTDLRRMLFVIADRFSRNISFINLIYVFRELISVIFIRLFLEYPHKWIVFNFDWLLLVIHLLYKDSIKMIRWLKKSCYAFFISIWHLHLFCNSINSNSFFGSTKKTVISFFCLWTCFHSWKQQPLQCFKERIKVK